MNHLLLKCKNVMFFFVIHETKLNIFGFWTVGADKEQSELCLSMEIVAFLVTFYRQNDGLVDN